MEKQYRAVWHREDGTIQKGLLTTQEEAFFQANYLIEIQDRIAWVEDEEGNKIETK